MRLLLYEYCCVQSDADPAGLALLHEGWGMLRALVEDLSRAGYRLVVLASGALERRLRTYPGVEVVVTTPESEREELTHWAPKVDACLLVAPEFRGILAERLRWVIAAGGRTLNCTPECVELVSNKLTICEQLQAEAEYRISFPPTERWSPSLHWPDVNYPAVLKPIDGAGSQATYLVRNRQELSRVAAQANAAGWSELIVQTYQEGLATSVCFLIGNRCERLRPTEQILSSDGRLRYQGARYPLGDHWQQKAWNLVWPDLWSLPGLLGWVGVDVNLQMGASSWDTIFDINPRVTTSYLALRQRCSNNLADAMVRFALGEEVDNLEWDSTPLEFCLE